MSRLVQAAKHYGCHKKRYKFEMHIHRVLLTSEKRKLFTRVLWSRGKKKQKKSHHNQRFKSKWCEGVETYNIDESIFDEATIYFTSNTNQIQSKHIKITLQIRERIDGKDVKFAKFELDLSKYVDTNSPHRIFYQRLTYQKARKKAQVIFTIKSTELMSDGNISEYTDNDDDNDNESHSNYTDDDTESVLSLATLNTLQNAHCNSNSNSHTLNNSNSHSHSPKLSSCSKKAAIHSNISGNKLKKRYFESSPTPTASSTSCGLTITRRGRTDMTDMSDVIDISTAAVTDHELQRKLQKKYKFYKYKYARLRAKVEEQEIEQRCQQDQICRLKRVEEQVKDQCHTMAKYKKKLKSMSKEGEWLKNTLQKRNQTIINLNKENSKLKQQIAALQTLETLKSVDIDIDFDDHVNKNETMLINESSSGKDEESTTTPMATAKETQIQTKARRQSTHIRNSDQLQISTEMVQKLSTDAVDDINYKKLYEKERARANHYKSKTSAAYKKYEKCEMQLSINTHEMEELQSKHKVMEEVYIKLKQDLTKMMDRYSKLEIEYEKIQNGVESLTDGDDNYDSV